MAEQPSVLCYGHAGESRVEAARTCGSSSINLKELWKLLIASCISNSLTLASPAVTVGSFTAKL